MKPRSLFVFLLTATAALAATVAYQARLLRERTVGLARGTVPSHQATQTAGRVAARNLSLTNAGPVGQFDWSQLESTNYFTYIANLRAVRCPEETIREIIMADVGKLFAARRAALQPAQRQFKFWQNGEPWSQGGAFDLEVQRRLRDLDREETALLRELLGVDYQREQAKLFGQDDDHERRFGFLPESKQTPVRDLLARYEAAEQDLFALARGFMTEEDEARLKLLQREREAELARLLTPEELEEFNLRNSDTANNLRYNLTGFEPTEEEFRKIFRLQKQFDDKFSATFDPTDDLKQHDYAAAQQRLQEDLRLALGDARFKDYERAQDGDYQTLVQIADRFNVGHDAANKVYEIQRAIDDQRQRIFADPTLPPEQKQQAYNSLLQDAEKGVAQLLGEPALKLYKKNGAAWLGGFDFMEDAPPPPLPLPLPNQ